MTTVDHPALIGCYSRIARSFGDAVQHLPDVLFGPGPFDS